MRRAVALVIAALWLCSACAPTAAPTVSWGEPLTATTPLPHRVAVLVDAAYMRRAADFRLFLPVDDSIALAAQITDYVEGAITGAKMEIALQNRYFILAYSQRDQLIARTIDADLFSSTAPIHLDPNICRSRQTTDEMLALWRGVYDVFTAQSRQLSPTFARDAGWRFQADTLAFVIAISRKDDDTTPTAPAVALEAGLERPVASLVAVALVRASDGVVVYHAIVPIVGPQRESTIRAAVDNAFAGLPRRVEHPSYSVPSHPETPPAEPPAADAPASPWIDMPAVQVPPLNTLPDGPFPGGLPAYLTGERDVSFMTRPGDVANPVAILPVNTPVLILRKDVTWYLVEGPNGVRGWVYGKFLRTP